MPTGDLILHFHKCFKRVTTGQFRSDLHEKTK